MSNRLILCRECKKDEYLVVSLSNIKKRKKRHRRVFALVSFARQLISTYLCVGACFPSKVSGNFC